jgi:NAD(P)-dependent dehydrogenase (short-subunit alcohol dehydrogenase family)
VKEASVSFKNTSAYCIVTGGNDGIGKEVAFHLARAGLNTILACRSESRGSAAASDIRGRLLTDVNSMSSINHLQQQPPIVECWSCDVGDLASVRSFADRVRSAHLRIAVLVCNAGVMATPLQLTKQGYEEQWAVNHLGHYLMVRLLANQLDVPNRPRVVMVSSHAHAHSKSLSEASFTQHQSPITLVPSYNPFESYYQSKLCGVCATMVLAKQWANTISVNAVHPGAVYTNIAKKNLPGILTFLESFTTSKILQKTVHEGASYVVRVALDPRLTETGLYYNTWRVGPPNSLALDPDTQRRVIAFSDQAIEPFLI